MTENASIDGLEMEWQGSHPFFDDFPEAENRPVSGFDLRPVVTVTRKASVKDVVLAFCGYMTIFDSNTIRSSSAGNLILALCAVILINPFEVKLLKGKGIDPLIDASAFDEETGERFINRNEFIKFCTDNNLSIEILNWLESKGFIYLKEDRIMFKKTFKNGRIFWNV